MSTVDLTSKTVEVKRYSALNFFDTKYCISCVFYIRNVLMLGMIHTCADFAVHTPDLVVTDLFTPKHLAYFLHFWAPNYALRITITKLRP